MFYNIDKDIKKGKEEIEYNKIQEEQMALKNKIK